jgi:hypothetical protein
MEQQKTGWVGLFLTAAGMFLALYVGTLLIGHWLAR